MTDELKGAAGSDERNCLICEKPFTVGHHSNDCLARLRAENERLKRGDFTPEELHALCHNLDEKGEPITAQAFCDGCEEYQKQLFGESPITTLRARLKDKEIRPANRCRNYHCGGVVERDGITFYCPNCYESIEADLADKTKWILKVCQIIQPAMTAEEWGADVADVIANRLAATLAELEKVKGERDEARAEVATIKEVAEHAYIEAEGHAALHHINIHKWELDTAIRIRDERIASLRAELERLKAQNENYDEFQDSLAEILGDCEPLKVQILDSVKDLQSSLTQLRQEKERAERVGREGAIKDAAKEACRWCKDDVPVKLKSFSDGFYFGFHTFHDDSTSECKAAGVLGLLEATKKGEGE